MAELKIKAYKTLDEAARDNSFWAINTTDTAGSVKRPKGNLVMSVRTRDGHNTPILLPPTWIPIDLREFAHPDDLLTAPAIRSNMRNKAITIVSEETVAMLRKNPAYAAESDRVKKLLNSFERPDSETIINIGTAPSIGGGPGNVIAQSSPLTDMILNAENDETIIRNYDTNLFGLTLGDLRFIQEKANQGSITYLIAMELQDALLSEGIKIKSVKETEIYKDVMLVHGGASAVNLSFE